MSDKNTTASTAHKAAAAEHQACADHHMKAAECHDHNKLADAKASSGNAMKCCETANKNTATACGCSAS